MKGRSLPVVGAATGGVLSTLNEDGSRRRLHPILARGRFWKRRRVVGFALIALFVLLPRIRIHGRPGLLIDLISREVTIFGSVFRPSDGFLLALLGLAVVATVFLVTALFGRVWCGWGCPQTVYLEMVFRPVETWLVGHRGQKATPLRRALKLVIFAALSFALANVFLAYFVGTDRLEMWVFESPLQHVGGFAVVIGVSALMLFDFGYFREQMCIVTCPYGRLQSVLLDKQSLIVGYDTRRASDCIDCKKCVAVCPTGIDIREGLQMECVGCAQCIDACDPIMEKVKKPVGLIRYTSQDELAGKTRSLFRTRVIVYPLLLIAAITGLAFATAKSGDTDVWLDRVSGPSFVDLPDGRVAAQVLVKLENRGDGPRVYRFALETTGALRSPLPAWDVAAHHSIQVPLFVDLARSAFVDGKAHARIRVYRDDGWAHELDATLLGPSQ
ncbi:MAG: cytochrome c oxidase accessory protein CcoG [Kofleriaceae bacterium]